MKEKPASTSAAARFTTKRIQVMIDQKTYAIVNMNVYDMLVAGAPGWIAPRQKLDFSFVLMLKGKEMVLPTYGAVIRNDGRGLEVRYQQPNRNWRNILLNVLVEEGGKA
ncbi:MAG: hypothetical protein E6Q98_13000 [Rhodospirillaceae bacterium]|nr:MAG: hypothetical protein E6Q98_13000 [Rhodospirillaceae bacterium]